jgi:hypothetical protein
VRPPPPATEVSCVGVARLWYHRSADAAREHTRQFEVFHAWCRENFDLRSCWAPKLQTFCLMRRVSAILTGLLVLTFSFSGWSNVCAAMSRNSATPTAHTMGGPSHHDSSHSHHLPADGTGNRTDHCQHAVSCSNSTLAPTVTGVAPAVEPSGKILLPNESLPSSQSPDLEPPPPKA